MNNFLDVNYQMVCPPPGLDHWVAQHQNALHQNALFQHHQMSAYQHHQCQCAACLNGGTNPYFTVPESPNSLYSAATPTTPVEYYFQDAQPSLVPPAPLLPPPALYNANSYHETAASLHQPGACRCEACMNQVPQNLAHTMEYFQQHQQQHHHAPEDKRSHQQAQPSRDIAVTDDAFQRIVGQMFDIARTSGGSSFLQACLKDKESDRFRVIHSELQPHFGELLLDSHGCYVMRSLMELMSIDLIHDVLETLACDEQLTFSLCTHSLHTRRIVQFLLETVRVEPCQFIVDVMIKQCREIATTQQGCIAMQRVMDCASESQKAAMYDKIYEHLMEFAHDPFANYVIQYILENGDKATTSEKVWQYFKGNVTPLACNKFASNVVEKALHHTSPEVQHLIVSELYANSAEFLQGMLQDSFGNYIVQATIALCSFKDVWMISEKLKPILHTTPYGYKIAARLERRLKGKPLTNARTVNYNQTQHLRS